MVDARRLNATVLCRFESERLVEVSHARPVVVKISNCFKSVAVADATGIGGDGQILNTGSASGPLDPESRHSELDPVVSGRVPSNDCHRFHVST